MAALKAVIFDMDGVLVDSEASYQDSVRRFFAERGVRIPEEELRSIVGSSYSFYSARIAGWWAQVEDPDPDEVAMGVDAAIGPYFVSAPEEIAALAKPGLCNVLLGLKARGLKLAVASASPARDIEAVLTACDIAGVFDSVLSGEDVARSKPDPAIYLATLDALGLPAEACIAVEDSDTGIAAARAAGIPVAALRETRFGFSQAGARWIVDALPELLPLADSLSSPNEKRGSRSDRLPHFLSGTMR